MNSLKRIIFFIICVILIILCSLTSFAHSGRTDSSGGHHDYKNRSGLGSYHYHHGYQAHLHSGGMCPYAPKDSIKITSYPKTISVGDNCAVEFTMNSYYNDFSYRVLSSDSSILKVNSDNSIMGVGVGTADITIKTSHAETTVSVTVKEVFAEKLEISASSSELQMGKTITINSTILPDNTTNKELTYTSSDYNIATVLSDGTIKGLASGSATITVTTSNGISQNIDINVFEVFPEDIYVDCNDSINFIVGDTYDFKVEILPDNANNKEFTITCENEEYLICNGLTLNAIKEGDTVLHIKTWNGMQKDLFVHIDFIPIEKIVINDKTQYIFQNVIDKSDEILLTSSISPRDATYQDVIWKSSNNNIVAVENDKFIINGTGDVVITCIGHGDVTSYIGIKIIDMNLIISISLIVLISGAVAIITIKRKYKSKS